MPANTYDVMSQIIGENEYAASHPEFLPTLLAQYGWTPEMYAAAGQPPQMQLPAGFTQVTSDGNDQEANAQANQAHFFTGPNGQLYIDNAMGTGNQAGQVTGGGYTLTPYSDAVSWGAAQNSPLDMFTEAPPFFWPIIGAGVAGGLAGGGSAAGAGGADIAYDVGANLVNNPEVFGTAGAAGTGAAGTGAAAGGVGVGEDDILQWGMDQFDTQGASGGFTADAGGLSQIPPGLQQLANAVRQLLGGGGTGGAGGTGTGGGSNLTGLANLLAGLYSLTTRSQVDPTKMNALWQAGQDTYNMARDPQNALRDTLAGRAVDASRAATSARGIGTSPVAAGMETEALRNFDQNWQNNLLQRQLSGLGGLSEATGGYYGQANQDRAFAANQGSAGLNALVTGANVLGQPGNWLDAFGTGTTNPIAAQSQQPRAQFDAWGNTMQV